MSTKKVLFGDDARLALKRGIDTVSLAVRLTLGPKGRNVTFSKSFGGPKITNDGVSVTKEIELSDKFEQMGVEIIKEVAEKMNRAAGDGTTTATVIAHAMVTEGLKYVRAGVEVLGIKRGIDMATNDIVETLKKSAKEIKNLEETKQVATVSVESEQLGTVIAQTIEHVGANGVVTVEESKTSDIESEVVKGLSFDKGYASPYMVSDPERAEAVVENASLLITDSKIDAVKDILPFLEKAMAAGRKDMVIIADDFGTELLTTLIVNKMRGIFNVVAIKAPGFGDRKKEILGDIAVTTGATVVSTDTGMSLETANIDVLGSAHKIIAKKDSTVIVGGKGNKTAIEARIAQLKSQMANATSTYDKEKIQERIAKLSGGVAIIRVGAATETEMKYLKDKIEDAVNATKAALEEGVVAGGGSALVCAATAVRQSIQNKKFEADEHKIGYEIVLAACEAPLRQIGANAGFGDGSLVVSKVSELGGAGGFNALTNTYVSDMLAEGILDPVKVTWNAVKQAASAAGTFLTTEVAIAEVPEPKKSTDVHSHDDY